MKKESFAPIGIIATLVSFFWFRIFAAHLISFQLDHEPVLLYTREYLLDHFLSFGGISDLFSRFLMQFYISPWLGAGALTIMTISLLYRAYKISNGKGELILLLWMISLAFITIVEGSIVIIVALTIVLRTIDDQEKTTNPKLLWLFRFIALPLLIWVTGSWAWLYLITVILRDNTSNRKSSLLTILYVIYAAILAFIAYRFIWTISVEKLFIGMFPFDTLIGIVLFVLSVVTLLSSFFSEPKHKSFRYSIYAIALTIFILTTIFNISNPQRVAERWRNYIKNGVYEKVIRNAKKNAPEDRIQTLYLNYALAKEDRLLDEMFTFPQVYGPKGLLPNPNRGFTTRNINEFWFIGHFYYEIGYIDKAHRIACDELIFNGVTPSYIKLMIKCLLADGHAQAASKYVYQLEHTLFFRKWAKEYRDMINKPASINKEFFTVKQLEPKKIEIISYDPAANLLTVLEQQPTNSLAFNYLCAYNLLRKQPAFLVDNVWVLYDLGYSTLPKYYQEAMLIYQLGHPNEKVALEGLRTDQKTVNAFIRFGAQFSKDKTPVLTNYIKPFKGMYVLYWFFTKKTQGAS